MSQSNAQLFLKFTIHLIHLSNRPSTRFARRRSDGGTDGKCESCPSGHRCPGGTKAMPCFPGSFRSETSLSTDESRKSCDPCVAGRYQGDGGKEDCSACPEGYFCIESSTAPIQCGSVALYCPTESPIVNAATSGYYTTPTSAPAENRVAQQRCEAGFACVGGVREECVEGSTYQSNHSQTSCITCSTCPAGTYETSACTTMSDTVCEPCPAGFACLEGVKASCTASSTYQPDPSKSSCLTCSTCPAGTYESSACTTTSDTVCEDCLAGSASIGGASAMCTPCTGDGQYSETDGATACKTAKAGYKPRSDRKVRMSKKQTGHLAPNNN